MLKYCAYAIPRLPIGPCGQDDRELYWAARRGLVHHLGAAYDIEVPRSWWWEKLVRTHEGED